MGVIPCRLVVEKAVRSLFVLLSDVLGLLVPLEPGLVLLVESPGLRFECLGGAVLLKGTLAVVKCVEEGVGIDTAVEPLVVEDGQWLLRVM